jgi:hypothetical protein
MPLWCSKKRLLIGVGIGVGLAVIIAVAAGVAIAKKKSTSAGGDLSIWAQEGHDCAHTGHSSFPGALQGVLVSSLRRRRPMPSPWLQ